VNIPRDVDVVLVDEYYRVLILILSIMIIGMTTTVFVEDCWSGLLVCILKLKQVQMRMRKGVMTKVRSQRMGLTRRNLISLSSTGRPPTFSRRLNIRVVFPTLN